MEYQQFLEALRRDVSSFETNIAAAGPRAAVPSCPGWTASDLCWHLTEVHYFFGTVVADRRQDLEGFERIGRPADDDLLTVFGDWSKHLIDALAGADPAEPVWTWSDDHTAGFVGRRMAHEAAVHAWDAAAATGRAATIEPALASDGIDEFLTYFVHRAAEGAAPVGGSVHIHCGDVAGEWTIQPPASAGAPFAVTREHAKGDCALRGPASDLLLALWHRTGAETIDIVGDTDVAARFLAATNVP